MDVDFLLKDGIVVDGTGGPGEPGRADIAISGDRIKAVGDLKGIRAAKTVNVKDLVVCPGFIDVHSHSDFILLADGRAEGKICQGITTEINGNCGMSAAPLYGAALEQRAVELEDLNIRDRWNSLDEYRHLLEKSGTAVNYAALIGHGNLRASVMGYEDRLPLEEEIGKMLGLLRAEIGSGAKGLSTGLIYPPGIFSETSELIKLAAEASLYKGVYTTHMRSEGDGLLESVDEAVSIAKGSGIHVHISHLKTSGSKNWGKLDEVFERMERARKEGLAVTCDRYPYTASSTDLDAILPSWAFEGGRKRELERLKTENVRLAEDILKNIPEASELSFWENIMISSVKSEKNKRMEGERVSEICGTTGKPPLRTVFDLLIEENLNVGAVFFLMSEKNLQSILSRPFTMIGTDSSARSYNGITANGKPHPRGFGSFPRVLGEYVREKKIMTLPEAVYRMTGLPAKTFHIEQRGVIAEGFYADLTVFDPCSINDTADFKDPFQRPGGIYHVFVNGTPVVIDGVITSAMPGRFIT